MSALARELAEPLGPAGSPSRSRPRSRSRRRCSRARRAARPRASGDSRERTREPGRRGSLPRADAYRIDAAMSVRRGSYPFLMAKAPTRIDLLELDIDLRLADLWREAPRSPSGTSRSWPRSCAPPTARATATRSPRTIPGSLCHDHGYRIPAAHVARPSTQRRAGVRARRGLGIRRRGRKRSPRGSSSRSRSRRCSRSSSSTRRSRAAARRRSSRASSRARRSRSSARRDASSAAARATRTPAACASGCGTSGRHGARGAVALHGHRPRPVPGRPRDRRRRAAQNGTFVAKPGLARDEVPVEVHRPKPNRRSRWLSSAARRSSSRSASSSTRSSPARYAAWRAGAAGSRSPRRTR